MIGDVGEAEAAVKPQRRIEFLDKNADGPAARTPGRLQGLQDRRADAAAAPIRQQRDVDDVQARGARVQIEPARRVAVPFDNIEAAAVDIIAVVTALRLELA